MVTVFNTKFRSVIKRPTGRTTSTSSGQTNCKKCTTTGKTDATSGQTYTTCEQTNGQT